MQQKRNFRDDYRCYSNVEHVSATMVDTSVRGLGGLIANFAFDAVQSAMSLRRYECSERSLLYSMSLYQVSNCNQAWMLLCLLKHTLTYTC